MFVIGLDYGTKRIGIALGDQTTQIAFPHKTVFNNTTGVKKIFDLIKQYDVKKIICGKPVQPNNHNSKSQLEVTMNEFLDEIVAKTDISKIIFIDETLTSAVSKGSKDKDSAAAILILEEYFGNMQRYEENI